MNESQKKFEEWYQEQCEKGWPDRGQFKTGAKRAWIARDPEIAALQAEKEHLNNIVMATCSDLGEIHDALGLDPDDAEGAGPIIEAIEELRKQVAELKEQLKYFGGIGV